MGKYREVSEYLHDNSIVSAQLERGFWPIYDKLLEGFTLASKNICEIGIGYGNSLVIWKEIFKEGNVLGIDIGSPVLEFNEAKGCNENQYENQLEGLRNVINVPLKYMRGIQFAWNRSGYDMEDLQQVFDAYPEGFDWVVNDGFQRGFSYTLLADWKSRITPTGLLFQEKIGRQTMDTVHAGYICKAITEGWLVYDMRQYNCMLGEPNHTGINPDSEGFLGIWSHNQDSVRAMLHEFEHLLVTGQDYLVNTTESHRLEWNL